MSSWVAPVGAWAAIEGDPYGDPRTWKACQRRAVTKAKAELEATLEALRLVGVVPCSTEAVVTATMSESGPVVVVEVAAIRLQHPCPFPLVRVVRWVPRWADRLVGWCSR